jgi:tetratricopeptide (TPR) repeat protein
MPHARLPAVAAIATACLAATVLSAATPPTAKEKPTPIRIKAADLRGVTVAIPLPDRPTVLLFARVGQDQSARAAKSLELALRDLPKAQVLVVLSGKEPDDEAKRKYAAKLPWPAVSDPDYAIVGHLRVRVWPTNVVIMPDGRELARLTGMPQSYARDLGAYLAFATGTIDRKTLDERLATAGIVGDSSQQMAARHLRVAQRLLEKNLLDQAWKEIEQGLKLQPTDIALQLAKVRVLLLLGQPVEADEALKAVKESPPWATQIGALTGGVMVALGRWREAVPVLEAALKLNPDPAEVHYFLGLAYQQTARPAEAAKAFRSAFEATAAGRRVAVSLRRSTTQPTIAPATPPKTKPK